MVELEGFILCMIKSDPTKMTLNIYQPDIINNITKVFNKYLKSPMNFNTPATPKKGVVRNQETDTKISYNIQKRV